MRSSHMLNSNSGKDYPFHRFAYLSGFLASDILFSIASLQGEGAVPCQELVSLLA